MAIKKKRGRPKKIKEPVKEETKKVVTEEEGEIMVVSPPPSENEVVARCACGEPVAEGQTAVCKNHIKAV